MKNNKKNDKNENNEKIEIAESRFVNDLVNKALRLERENKEIKAENEKLLRLVAQLSGGRRITVHDDFGTELPRFDISENIGGELIYTVRGIEDEEFIDLDRARARRSFARTSGIAPFPVSLRRGPSRTVTVKQIIELELGNGGDSYGK